MSQLAIKLASIFAPAIALIDAGGILCLSYYPLPIIRKTNSDTSTNVALLQIRFLFKSGQYPFPGAAIAAAACYAFLAYALPARRSAYIAAAASCMAIAPFTTRIMVPLANGRLIELHEQAAKGKFEGQKGNMEVDRLFRKFETLNIIRSGSVFIGGFIGLWMLVA